MDPMIPSYDLRPATGSLHTITLTAAIRGAWFVHEPECRLLLECFEYQRAKLDLECIGYVLMPDYFRALLRQNGSGPLVRKLTQGFKRFTTRKLRLPEYPGLAMWRLRTEDVALPDLEAAAAELAAIHDEPVKAGLAANSEEYPWSSAHRTDEQPPLVTVTAL
jgi:putative transposase